MEKDATPPLRPAQQEMLKKWFPNQTGEIDEMPSRSGELKDPYKPVNKTKQSLIIALKECLIPEAGCGCIEYRVDGSALYDRVKGICDSL